MSINRVSKLEVGLVALTVLALALTYRYAWTTPFWESDLLGAQERLNLPVAGAGRWFSGWTRVDGQAYALIAADPLGIDVGWQLGHPSYRYGRAGFGWLAWLASFGQAEFIPYGMAAVGVLALIGTFAVALWFRPKLGQAAWLLVFNPAVFIGFAGDMAETLAVLLLALGLGMGSGWASVFLGIVRPTYLVAMFSHWKLAAWGIGTAIALGFFWITRFGLELGQYGGRLGLPFVGYAEHPSIHSIGLALLAAITMGVGSRSRNWAWVASGLVVLCFAGGVVEEAANSWRAGGMLLVLWAFGPEHKAGEDLRNVDGQWRRMFSPVSQPETGSLNRTRVSSDVG